MLRQSPLSVIPAKRSASRNRARCRGNDLHSRDEVLDSRPGLLSAGVTFFRWNDTGAHKASEQLNSPTISRIGIQFANLSKKEAEFLGQVA
jgi:hypothetical protein